MPFAVGQQLLYRHTFSQWFGDSISAHAQK